MKKKVAHKKKAAAPADKPLSHREHLFADHFLICGEGRQSAITAGYAEHTARVTASKLLKKPHIAAYIEARKEKIYDKLELTQERVMKEYARIALSDIRSFFNADGSLKAVHDLSDDAAAALSSVETDELDEYIDGNKTQVGTTRKLKLWDKKGALDSICRIKGWNAPEEVNLKGKIRIGYGREEE